MHERKPEKLFKYVLYIEILFKPSVTAYHLVTFRNQYGIKTTTKKSDEFCLYYF